MVVLAIKITFKISNEYYLYDAMGRTVGTYDYVANAGAGQWNWYVFGGNRVAQFKPNSTQQSTLSGSPATALNSSNYSDVPTYTNFANVAQPLNYFVYDHLGSTRVSYSATVNALTNVVTYTVKSIHDYKPYGTVFREYLQGQQDKYQFTGYERDAEIGLDNANAREYDGGDVPVFLQTDPLKERYPNWSSYGYCMGNPVNLVDPTGNVAWKPDAEGNLVAEKGDNATTLANYLHTSVEQSTKMLADQGHTVNDKGVLSLNIGDKIKLARSAQNGGGDKQAAAPGGNSIWQIGISGVAAIGPAGVAGGFGATINFDNWDVDFYANGGYAFGADLSVGVNVTRNVARGNKHIESENLQGWGNNHNVGVWVIDGSYGGDNYDQKGNLSNFGASYYSYGEGLSLSPLPISYSNQYTKTWTYGR